MCCVIDRILAVARLLRLPAPAYSSFEVAPDRKRSLNNKATHGNKAALLPFIPELEK
jgi:hypothetical protein